ncbi:hypothetical protein ACFXGR_22370 [Streptomyces mirabilis]|uniref:hypothetical protein n=1 Tax=Streptomyces mirabilis TaxID=68239 RepID=UPI0036B637F5
MTDQTAHQPLTDQQLDEIEKMPRAEDIDLLATEVRRLRAELVEQRGEVDKLVRWHREDGAEMDKQRATISRLRTRVAELEGPAVEARAALAALCYDLEDPGTAALGALYLISQATVGVEAPRDDAAQALARHDADVIRKAAETLEATDRDDDAVNLLYLLADTTERAEETHVVADDSDDPEHVDDCPGCPAPVAAVVSSAAGTPGNAR